MGVLESMRSSSDSTFMQVVLVLIIVSFVGWMSVPQGDKTSVVVTVNGVQVMDTEYRQLYSNVKRQRENELERPLTNAEEQSIGEQVRQELVRRQVVLQKARELGLVVSNHELQWENIRTGQLVGYADESGAIDQERYTNYLSLRGLTQGRYETQLAEGLLIQKLQHLLVLGPTISEPLLRKTFEESQRRVSVEYARIRPSAFFQAIEVSDEEADSWLAANAEAAREIYDRDFASRYAHPAQLGLSLIQLRVEEGQTAADLLPRINAIREQLAEGADFAELARKHSEHPSSADGGSLGTRPLMQIGVEVTDAVAGVEVGQLTRAVTGERHVRLYRVDERVEASEDSFEDVQRAIAVDEIRREKAPSIAVDFAEGELLPAWKAAGAPPAELLADRKLSAQTSQLLGTGDPPSIAGPPPELIAKALDLEEGAVIDEVIESGGVYWVAQVARKQQANMDEFERFRERIADQELLTRRSQLLEAWITDQVSTATVR